MRISPDHKELQYSGRIDFDDPKAPVLVFAGSFIHMRFTGTSVKAVIANRKSYWTNYMGYILDGKQDKFPLDNGSEINTYTIAENLEDKVQSGRIHLTEREAGERKRDFAGVENSMSLEEARQESGRCLRCDAFGCGVLRGGRENVW